jgi:hypothetical protein
MFLQSAAGAIETFMVHDPHTLPVDTALIGSGESGVFQCDVCSLSAKVLTVSGCAAELMVPQVPRAIDGFVDSAAAAVPSAGPSTADASSVSFLDNASSPLSELSPASRKRPGASKKRSRVSGGVPDTQPLLLPYVVSAPPPRGQAIPPVEGVYARFDVGSCSMVGPPSKVDVPYHPSGDIAAMVLSAPWQDDELDGFMDYPLEVSCGNLSGFACQIVETPLDVYHSRQRRCLMSRWRI